MSAVMQHMDNSEPFFCDYDRTDPLHKEYFGLLNREWIARHFFVEPQDETAFNDPESTVLDKGGVIVMAYMDGMIVGTGSLLCHADGSCEIAKMAVTESCQGRGIGEKLLLTLMERARALNVAKIYIVSNTRLTRAIRLYRKHGFTDSAENRHTHYARGDITLECNLL